MKKLLAIIVLGLLFSGNVYANNLIGKQLECENSSRFYAAPNYYIFRTSTEAESISIARSSLKVVDGTVYYTASAKAIDIYIDKARVLDLLTIDRESLKTSKGTKCKLVRFNIKEYLGKISKQLLEKQLKKNKI